MDSQEKIAHDEEEQTSVQKQTGYGWFPFAHILMLIWLCYIGLMLALLQSTVERAKTSTHIPWGLSSLPGILLTGFAQAHLPITAMYLSRLGLVALQRESMQPRSWAELLWLAGSKWQSPVGILTVGMDYRKTRQRISATFFLFAATCLVATATPVVISKGWPTSSVSVGKRGPQQETAYLPASVDTVDLTSHLGAGEGSWATGLEADDVYGSIMYDPDNSLGSPDLSSGSPGITEYDDDYFFSGSVQGEDVDMTGLRIQGGCDVVFNGRDAPPPSPPTSLQDFEQMCHRSLDSVGTVDQANSTNLKDTLVLWWCIDSAGTLNTTDELLSPPTPLTRALIWYNETNDNDYGSSTTQAFITCNVTFTEGNATVSGSDASYTHFVASPRQDWGSSGDPFHPLVLLLLDIKQSFDATLDPSGRQAVNIRRALKYENFDAGDGDSFWVAPDEYTVADQLWQGVAHMTAAMVLLSSVEQTFNETLYTFVNARVERKPFIAAGGALLATWFVLLVICTARLHGRTFGGSLDIYVAARQLSEGPQILQGQPFGSMAENPRLREPYRFTVDVDRA